ncbi:MAG: VTT domain-containing protein [Caldilineaceae bacterium]
MSESPDNKHTVIFYKLLLYRHWLKLVGFLLWSLLIGAYAYYLWTNHLTAHEALMQLVDLLNSPWGPLLYIFVYICSPLFFFSAAVLAILGGAVFGAGSVENLIVAILYTIIGSLGAAQTAYALGRWFGAGLLPTDDGLVHRYTERMRQQSFMTILLMHILFLPYELVNYLAGILRIDRRAFLLATFLGSLPGFFTFVPFGASLDLKSLMLGEGPHFSVGSLLFGLLVLVASLLIARYLRQREQKSALP